MRVIGSGIALLLNSYLTSRLGSHRDAMICKKFFGLAYGVFLEVENGCGEGGVGPPFLEGRPKVFEVARTAAGDDGYADGIGHGPCQGDIITIFGAVTVHRGEENLAGPPSLGFDGPCYGFESGGPAAAPSAMAFDDVMAVRHLFCVNGDDDALRPEPAGGLVDEIRVLDGGRVNRDLVGSRGE